MVVLPHMVPTAAALAAAATEPVQGKQTTRPSSYHTLANDELSLACRCIIQARYVARAAPASDARRIERAAAATSLQIRFVATYCLCCFCFK